MTIAGIRHRTIVIATGTISISIRVTPASTFGSASAQAGDTIFHSGADAHFGGNWGHPLNAMLGGWELTGIQSWQTGIPYTPVTYYDPANSPTYSGVARAEIVGNPYDYSGCPG